MTNTERPRAVVYVRLSQDRTGTAPSIDRQRQDCQALADREGWHVVEVIVDRDKSAYKDRPRPGFQRLVELVRDGNVDHVVAQAADRLWRQPMDELTFMAVARAAGLSSVTTVAGGPVRPGAESDELVSTLLAVVGRRESAATSRRIRRARAQAVAEGRWTGGKVPLGYVRDPDGDGIRQDPDVAPHVREAADAILSGSSWARAARTLGERLGRPVAVPSLRAVLQGYAVAGLAGEGAPGRWPGIITAQERERILESRKAYAPRGRPGRSWLMGVAFCSVCGSPLRANWSKYKSGLVAVSQCGNGGHTAIVEERLHDHVEGVLLNYLTSDQAVADVARARAEIAAADAAAATVAGELDDARARLAAADDAFADGELDAQRHRRITARLAERIAKLEDQLHRTSPAGRMAAVDPALVARAWGTFDHAERRTLLTSLRVRVELAPAGQRIVPVEQRVTVTFGP